MKNFAFEMEGFDTLSVPEVFQGITIESLAIPAGHSLTAAWLVLLSLSSGVLVELCSRYNDLGDWLEVGSLKLRLIKGKLHDAPGVDWVSYIVDDFNVEIVEKIGYYGANFQTECGLGLISSQGTEILVVAGPSPGSVSVRLPHSLDNFVTELPIEECVRTRLE